MSVRCGHCCIANEGCQSSDTTAIPCPNCLPKWRCLTEEFVPEPYSDACETTYMAKMAFDCDSQSYVVVRHPVIPQLPVHVTATLMTRVNPDNKTECFYRVAMSHPDGDPVTIDLELTELSNELEYEADGGTYVITIGGKVGICSPVADAQCSPCRVYTCIPEKLLVTLQFSRSVGCIASGQDVNIIADWADLAYFGTLDIGDETVDVVVTPLATQCGFHVVIDGIPEGGVVDPFDIILEGAVEPDGDPCDHYSRVTNKLAVGGDGFATTHRGRSGCSGSITTSLIYATFTIRDYEGESMGSGVIRDGDCVAVRVAAEHRACCLNLERLCPYTQHLHLGIIAPTCSGGLDGFATILHQGAGAGNPDDECFTDGESLVGPIWNNAQPQGGTIWIQCGPPGLCAPLPIQFQLACCYSPICDTVPPEDASKYKLWILRGSKDPGPTQVPLTFFSCDPFILEFETDATWVTGGCDCCPEGGIMTIRVTK